MWRMLVVSPASNDVNCSIKEWKYVEKGDKWNNISKNKLNIDANSLFSYWHFVWNERSGDENWFYKPHIKWHKGLAYTTLCYSFLRLQKLLTTMYRCKPGSFRSNTLCIGRLQFFVFSQVRLLIRLLIQITRLNICLPKVFGMSPSLREHSG